MRKMLPMKPYISTKERNLVHSLHVCSERRLRYEFRIGYLMGKLADYTKTLENKTFHYAKTNKETLIHVIPKMKWGVEFHHSDLFTPTYTKIFRIVGWEKDPDSDVALITHSKSGTVLFDSDSKISLVKRIQKAVISQFSNKLKRAYRSYFTYDNKLKDIYHQYTTLSRDKIYLDFAEAFPTAMRYTKQEIQDAIDLALMYIHSTNFSDIHIDLVNPE